MAIKQQSSKELSKQFEDYVAKRYQGVRSPSSGAADTDRGDVRSRIDDTLFECKARGPEHKTIPGFIKILEKVADEAWSEGRDPSVCMRFWDPSSPLANNYGYIDTTIRLLEDDVKRAERLWDAEA